MKKILKQILSFGILVLLCAPVSFAGAKQDGFFDETQTGTAAFTVIKIIDAGHQPKITLAGVGPAMAQICDNPIVKPTTLVQDQYGVNLNQPADCFNLANVVMAQAQASLAVRPLARANQQIVALPSSKIAGAHYGQPTGLPFKSPGVIPISDALIIIVAMGFIGSFNSKHKKSVVQNIRQALSLEQLQVMRC